MDENFIYENITLRNITINDPQFSYGQGVILGNPVTPMQEENQLKLDRPYIFYCQNIVFDGVRVLNAKDEKVGRYHTCDGVETGLALGDTSPVPPCFQDRTNT